VESSRRQQMSVTDYRNWVFPFGKHKGETLRELPSGYLNWLRDKGIMNGEWADAVELELENRQ